MNLPLFVFKYFGLLGVILGFATLQDAGVGAAIAILAAWGLALPFAPSSDSLLFHRLLFAQITMLSGFIGGLIIIYTTNFRVPPDADQTFAELLGWVCLAIALWGSYEFVKGPTTAEASTQAPSHPDSR